SVLLLLPNPCYSVALDEDINSLENVTYTLPMISNIHDVVEAMTGMWYNDLPINMQSFSDILNSNCGSSVLDSLGDEFGENQDDIDASVKLYSNITFTLFHLWHRQIFNILEEITRGNKNIEIEEIDVLNDDLNPVETTI